MLLRHRSARSLARRALALSALVALGLGFAGCGESFTSCETTRTCATGTSTGGAPSGGTSTGGQSNGASGGARSGGAESTGGSETGGEDSSGGMGGLPFSCSLCDADTPVCLEDLEQCAECSPDNNPDPSDQDTDDTSSSDHNPDCSPDTPVCSPDFECAECLSDDHCTDDALPACTDEYTCAQCSQNSHCLDPAASACDLNNNQCSPCTENDDCAHLQDSPLCDSKSGTCVQCSPLTEEDDCGTFSCDPATLTCTTTERNSLEPCEPCLADSECENPQNHLCVPLVWGSGDAKTERGGYCLQTVTAGCDRPFLIDIKDRVSLSGVSGETYCGINEALTTCDAVFALLKDHTCSDRENSSDCPDGGLCRKVGNSSSPRCTYECSDPTECKNPPTAGNTCGPGATPDPVTPDYCGGKD